MLKNHLILFSIILFFALNLQAQSTDVIKCATVDIEKSRLDDKYERYFELFEEYIENQRAALSGSRVNTVYTIPIVFHIIHDGDAVGSGDNIGAQYVDAQLEQLNNDFRRIMGTTGFGSMGDGGVDTEIEFCAATVDENGVPLAEPGIDRIDRNTKGWTAPPYGTPILGCILGADLDYIDNTIKPNSIWDPEEYLNIWVLDMVCGVLGYAQSPEAASLPGIGTGNGGADSDGVVVLPGTVGSTDLPAAPAVASTPYDKGRTLTHEIGHWVGLRHIWGDGDCNADDFCADTPNAGGSNFGCPTVDSCPGDGPDQVENYMDYTDDDCMNIFTQDQTDRMRIVMGETGMGSPRREILLSSPACGASAEGFSITATNSPVTVTTPDDAVFNFNVSFTGSFSGSVTLSAVGLPAGATATFSTNPVTSAGSYTLTVGNIGSIALGTYNFSIDGTDGGTLTDSEAVTLIVEEESDCTTVVSSDVPVTISDNSTVSSDIVFSESGTISDVNVLFAGDHGRARDLSFELRSPDGTTIQLIDVDDPCNGGANDFDLGFDDESALTINADLPCPPIDGRFYQPEQALSTFNGEEANGTWTLIITDNLNSNSGTLNSWQLEVCVTPSGETCETDVTVSDPIAITTYKASNSIQSDATVTGTGMDTVIFEAGNFIQLNDGFTVTAGSNFIARIQACTPSAAPNQVEARTEIVSRMMTSDLKVFPNPFNEQTTIQLDLAEASELTVELYDLSGRKVSVVVNTNAQAAGQYNYTLNAANLEAGIYVLMVRIGTEVMTKKLSILK